MRARTTARTRSSTLSRLFIQASNNSPLKWKSCQRCLRYDFSWLTEDELIYENALEVAFDTTDTINYLCTCTQSFWMVKSSCCTIVLFIDIDYIHTVHTQIRHFTQRHKGMVDNKTFTKAGGFCP